MKQIFPRVLIIVLLIASAVLAAPLKTNEEFIQGTWYLSGENDGHSWFLEWKFERGSFVLKGYPPLFQEGKYRIVKTEKKKLTVELYEQKGNFGTENSRIEIIIDKDKNSLMIKGQGPFKRTKNRS